MQNKIADSCDIKNFHGKLMGYAYIKAQISHTQHYECAAWHETAVSDSHVVVPLTLVEDYHNPHDLMLSGSVPGKVTDNYFQSLWCGNKIGESYDTKKDKGKPKDVGISVPLYESLESSFQLIGDKNAYHGIYVSREHIGVIEEYYQKQLEHYRDYMSDLIAEHREFGNKGSWGGEFNNCANQLGHAGDKLRVFSKILDRINFLNGSYGKDYGPPPWMETVKAGDKAVYVEEPKKPWE